ncbi:MAG TPA: UDP-3-O-(3-hydroxymyristoyl)glucosamine N-acyltransferase [Bacteroidia bacterium]
MSPFTIKEILSHFPECKFEGNENTVLSEVIAIKDLAHEPRSSAMAWISDKKLDEVKTTVSLGLLILSPAGYDKFKNSKCNFLISPKPRLTFLKLMELKFSSKREPAIEKTAVIHPSVKMGKDCYIGNHVVIEEGSVLKDNVEILHNTVILKNTHIGNGVKIGCNCTIGNYGFGYEKDEDGSYLLITHIGNVVIEDHVEIGNNTAIDRAVMGSTFIRKNAKIDNLVHIAHGVEIGENSLIIANAMIGGSVRIGKNVWVAPSTSILNQKKVDDNALVGMGAVVLKDVPASDVVVGNPARSIKKNP